MTFSKAFSLLLLLGSVCLTGSVPAPLYPGLRGLGNVALELYGHPTEVGSDLKMSQDSTQDEDHSDPADRRYNSSDFPQGVPAQRTVDNMDVLSEKLMLHFMNLADKIGFDKTCVMCKIVTNFARIAVKAKEEKIADLVEKICINLKIQDADICTGIIDAFKAEFLGVLEDLVLARGELCGAILGPSCAHFYDPYQMWNITIPASLETNSPSRTDFSAIEKNFVGPTLRVLQLSDIHVDMKYEEGSSVDCSRPVCCRKTSGPVPPSGRKAGRFGSYGKCDLPSVTVEHAFKYLSKNDKFDYILWTGDLPSHADWDQSEDNQLQLISYLTRLFLKYFPDTPVFPALGNHEGFPVNAFAPPYITGKGSISWLYQDLVTSWSHWIPAEAKDSIKTGGYYTALIRPGFRIISLNMNYCNTENWWMLINSTDPAGELTWLVRVLSDSERAGEKVQIIGHIPPGLHDCMKAWSWNYYKIVNRFSATIAGQFFGHTHTDLLELFFDEQTLQKPISVAYVSPSLTTYSNFNPGYRVYTIDGFYNQSSWSVLDHATFIMNLTKANTEPEADPQWEEEYSAKKAYNMTSLTPEDWKLIAEKIPRDPDFANLFHKHFQKSPPPFLSTVCDQACANHYACMLRSGRSDDPSLCQNLTRWEDFQRWQRMTSYC